MFARIMRSLGYVPFAALVQAEEEINQHKARASDWAKKVDEKDGQIRSHVTMRTELKRDLDAAIALNREYAGRDRPHVFVGAEPKRLSLLLARTAIDKSPVVLKQGVRNKANEAHYADLMKAANTLISEAFAPVKPSPVKGAASGPNPHAGVPMTDKPR